MIRVQLHLDLNFIEIKPRTREQALPSNRSLFLQNGPVLGQYFDLIGSLFGSLNDLSEVIIYFLGCGYPGVIQAAASNRWKNFHLLEDIHLLAANYNCSHNLRVVNNSCAIALPMLVM